MVELDEQPIIEREGLGDDKTNPPTAEKAPRSDTAASHKDAECMAPYKNIARMRMWLLRYESSGMCALNLILTVFLFPFFLFFSR